MYVLAVLARTHPYTYPAQNARYDAYSRSCTLTLSLSMQVPGGLCDGKLEVADAIVAVNGVDARPMSHAEAIRALSAGLRINLVVERIVLASTGRGFRRKGRCES